MKKTLKRKSSLLLLLALALTLFCGCGEKRELSKGEIEGAPYPCSWEEKKNGSFIIHITLEQPESAEWSVMADSAALSAERNGNSSEFTIRGTAAGNAKVLLRMRESGLPVEKGADFLFSFTVGEKKLLTLNAAEASVVSADSFVSEDGTALYWQQSEKGSLFLTLNGTGWSVETFEGVSRLGPTLTENTARLEIAAEGESTERSLIIRNDESAQRYAFTFALHDGALEVESCRILPEEKTDSDALTEEQQIVLENYQAAATEEEKEEILTAYASARKQAERDARLQEAIEELTEKLGRAPSEKEIDQLKDIMFGDY